LKAAYFHCIGGASGDMILGSLLDAGLSLEALKGELAKLPVNGYSVESEPAQRGGVKGTLVTVRAQESSGHRHLQDIQSLLEQSRLPKSVKGKAVQVFRRLAHAEAKIHGVPVEEVELHEVGALDAIVDIVGAVAGLHLLGVEKVFSSPLPSGLGTVRSGHGTLPSPAPATLELLAEVEAPVHTPGPGVPQGEMVTPTAAAILTTLASFDAPTLKIHGVGYGLGHKEWAEVPNVLALWIGEMASQYQQRQLSLTETNIDDMSPELLGPVIERLMKAGARDAWFTPIQMKKNRPGVMVSVLASPEMQSTVLDILFRETSTLGARVQPVERYEVDREITPFESSLGKVDIKVKRIGDDVVSLSPEFEDCKRLAEEHRLPLQDVYRIVEEEARKRLLPL